MNTNLEHHCDEDWTPFTQNLCEWLDNATEDEKLKFLEEMAQPETAEERPTIDELFHWLSEVNNDLI